MVAAAVKIPDLLSLSLPALRLADVCEPTVITRRDLPDARWNSGAGIRRRDGKIARDTAHTRPLQVARRQTGYAGYTGPCA